MTCPEEGATRPVTAHYTVASDVKTFSRDGWVITATKSAMANAQALESASEALGFAPPDMLFPHNTLHISHPTLHFHLHWDALSALQHVSRTVDETVKVHASASWKATRQPDASTLTPLIDRVIKKQDWTFQPTGYRGEAYVENDAGRAAAPSQSDPDRTLDFALLSRPDPILFFHEMVLFEDELADNGTAICSLKIRVMPSAIFVLLRYFLRVDHVLFRIQDTRTQILFGPSQPVLREAITAHATWEQLQEVSLDSFIEKANLD